MDKPIVSVCVITYNHEFYIEDTLMGIFEQNLDLPMELIISNDASQDETNTVIQRILKKKPSRLQIKYFDQPENLGMMQNFSFALNECNGRYVAICEGDDYWKDPLKLKKQVEFLEQYKECSFCFHKALIKEEESQNNKFKEAFPLNLEKNILNASQFFSLETIPTCSVLFRNISLRSIAKLGHKNGDFLLYSELLQLGKAGFINEVMSIYRRHSNGVSFQHEAEPYLWTRIKELKKEQRYFKNPEVKEEIGILYKRHILRYFHLYKMRIPSSRKYYLKKELYLNRSFLSSVINRFKRKFKKRINSIFNPI